MKSLVISIPTYKRNDELAELLTALAMQVPLDGDSVPRVRCLVIDNNPDGRAHSVVETATRQHPDLHLTYVHETQPGVTHVRNRALDEAQGDDLLAFIDDDELPDEGWLAALWRGHVRSNAAVVFGTVEARFDSPPPDWLREGDFHSKPVLADGPRAKPGATDNCLIDLAVVRRHGLRFDPALSLIGGEDTLFFDALLQAGETFENAAGARTFERIPDDRATLGWLLTRWRRTGLTDGMMIARRRGDSVTSRVRALIDAVLRIGAGGALSAISHAISGGKMSAATARRLYTYQRGRGMLSFVMGEKINEYGR